MNKNKKQHLINSEIKARKIRIEGEVLTLDEGLSRAEDNDMDLVLIAPNAEPPVCKIMNYEKFIYEQSKKDKQKVLDLKEIKVGPNTSENDISYRVKQMNDFLNKGHKVKITMQFNGREMVYVENGKALILKMILAVEDLGVPEFLPKLEGKKLFVIIRPKNKK